MNIGILKSNLLKSKPEDITKVSFGKIFTDHMFEMTYSKEKGWHKAKIVPYSSVDMSPATSALHYGQTVFEGIKAFKTKNGEVKVFRLKDHLERLNRSCEILDIPLIDVDFIKKAIIKLVDIDRDWVPNLKGSSLYIRPFIFNNEETVNITVGNSYKLMVILSPVSSLYVNGFNPVKIMVEDKYVRAVLGGLGEAKTAANYAASLHASLEAKKKGYDQVLWLDAIKHEYIEEVGSMNIFFKIDGELVTPKLNGSILDGITRRTVIKIAKEWNIPVAERKISINDIIDAYKSQKLEEVFGTGTAAIISPVGELCYKNNKMIINNNVIGAFSQKVFDYITNMQNGIEEDKFNFFDLV